MIKVTEKVFLMFTYSLSVFNIVWDFDTVRKWVIFVPTLILLVLQLRKYIREEIKNYKQENPKKNETLKGTGKP